MNMDSHFTTRSQRHFELKITKFTELLAICNDITQKLKHCCKVKVGIECVEFLYSKKLRTCSKTVVKLSSTPSLSACRSNLYSHFIKHLLLVPQLAMASAFSPAYQVRSICSDLPKALVSFSDSKVKFRCVNSWSSSSKYVKLQAGPKGLSRKHSVVSKPLRRAGVVRAATIEEIDKEKGVIEKDAKERMEKTIESMKSGFNSLRSGRANPTMLDKIEVEYYGTPVNLKSIAQVSTPDSSSFLVQPYDKSSLKSIEKAIVTSDLGLTPNNDGDVIRLSLPPLTSERRKELTKLVSKQAEETKVAVRNIRRDAIKAYEKLEKDKKLSEDLVKDLTGDLQKVTDEYMKKIDLIYKQKEKELMTV